MNRHSPLSVLVALAAGAGALLGPAPSAAADDASLFATYNARQPTDLAAASAEYKRAFRIVRRSDGRRGVRAVMRANRRINAVLKVIEGELAAQAPSSEHGVTARRSAIREVRGWHRANRYENRGWRTAARGDSPRRLMDRATDEFLRAFRQGRRAVRHFKAVGLSSPLRAITQTP
jgi:hypothetical protein